MPHPLNPAATTALAAHRAELAPDTHDAFQAFSTHSGIALNAAGVGSDPHR